MLQEADYYAHALLKQANKSFPGEVTLGKLTISGGKLLLSNVVLKDANGEPLIEVPQISAGIDWPNFFHFRHWIALPGQIAIDKPCVYLTIDENGVFNFSTIAVEKDHKEAKPLPPLEYLAAQVHLTDGRVVCKDLRQGGFIYELEDLNATVSAHPQQLADVSLSLRPKQDTPGELTLTGQIAPDEPKFSARVELKDWQLKRLAEHPLISRQVSCHEGMLNASLWAKCHTAFWDKVASALSYGGTAQLSDGVVMVPGYDVPVRQIRATAKIASGMVEVRDGFANLAGTGAMLTGRVYLPPRPRFDLHLQVPRLRTEPIAQVLHRELPVKGKAKVEVDLGGTFAHPELNGCFDIERLSAQGQDLTNCEISWSFADKLLSIDSVKGQAVGGAFQGKGYVFLDEDPYVLFTMDGNANLQGLSPVGGNVNSLKVNLLGTLKDPLVYGSSSGSGFSGAAAPLESVSAHFLYSDGDVLLSQGQAHTDWGTVNLPYAFYDLKESQMVAAVDTSGFTIPTLQVKGLGTINGRVGGQFQVSGNIQDLNSLSLYGFSRSSQVNINNVAFTDFNGSLGFQNMSLFFPCLSGHGAEGDLSLAGWVGFKCNGSMLAYSGDGNISLLGEGVCLDQLASMVNVKLPLDLSSRADIGASWFAKGSNRGNWAALYANSPTSAHGAPFAMASRAGLVGQNLGAIAWSTDVPVKPIKLTPELTYAGEVTGQFGVAGALDNLNIGYCANLAHMPLSGLIDDTVHGMGTGNYSHGKVTLDENLISWDYHRPNFDRNAKHIVGMTGHANPWFGSEISAALTPNKESFSFLRENGSLVLGGWVKPGNDLAYDISFNALGVDLYWLAHQDNIPQIKKAAEAINLVGGETSASGQIKSAHGVMQLMPGTNFDIPWMLMAKNGDFDVFSGVGGLWTEPGKKGVNGGIGTIHVDPLVLSRQAFDPTLPYGSEIAKYDWLGNFRSGWLYLDGLIDQPEISLAVAMDGWNLDSILAFAPKSLKIDENICTGLWHTDNLNLFVNTQKDIMKSIEIQGTLGMENGNLNINNWSVPIKKFNTSISEKGTQLSLDELLIDTGILKLEGRGERTAAGAWTADIWSESIPLQYISSFDSRFSRLNGSGQMALHLTSPNSNFSSPTLNLGFQGQDISLRPANNRTELFFSSSQKQTDESETTLSQKIFGSGENDSNAEDSPREQKVDEAQARERARRQFGEQILASLSNPVRFSRFEIGRIERDEEGRLFTNEDLGLTLHRQPDHFTLNIPDDALYIEAYSKALSLSDFGPNRENADAKKTENKGTAGEEASSSSASSEPQSSAEAIPAGKTASSESQASAKANSADNPSSTEAQQDTGTAKAASASGEEIPESTKSTLTAAGRIDFGLDFSQGIGNWFMGPNGPDFGTDNRPFTLKVKNFNNNLLRSALGKMPDDGCLSFSGALKLQGQWHRNSDLSKPSDSLEYLLSLDELNVGHYIGDKDIGEWVGLELEDRIDLHYGLEGQLGRLIVPPFHLKPHATEGALEKNKKSNAKGADKERENAGMMVGEANLVLAKSSPDLAQEADSFARLQISNMPVVNLSSFISENSSLGYINSIDFTSQGPLMSPDLDLSFNVTDGKVGPIDFAALEGNVSARADGEDYLVDIGDDISDALRLYFGKNKRPDWSANLWGKLPFKVKRAQLDYHNSLLPVWEGVSFTEAGDLDVVAELTDKHFSTALDLIPDINKANGTMEGKFQISGTSAQPNVSGFLNINNAYIDHDKAGEITDINLATTFDKVPIKQLHQEFQERAQRNMTFAQRAALRQQEEEEAKQAQALAASPSPHALASNSGKSSDADKAQNKEGRQRDRHPGLTPPTINRLTIKKFQGKIGGQPFKAQGRADLLGFIPIEAEIDFNGKDLPLRWGNLFEGIVDVDLDINANQQRRQDSAESEMVMVLTGDINVKSGEVDVPMSGLGGDGSSFNWKSVPLYYQLLLNMGEDVWINAYNSRVRTTGTLYIMPNIESNAPELAGSVDISRGTLAVPFYDVRFKLRSGQLTFESQNNPVLEDVMAESEVSGYSISTFVDGTYPNINLRFSSYPYLSDDEIKQLLALGSLNNSANANINQEYVGYTGAPTIGNRQYGSSDWSVNNQGTAMLSRMLSSTVTSSISRLLFLSDFSVDMDSSSCYTMKLAKALDKNERVLFTLTRTMDSRTNTQYNLYGIEWRIKNNLMTRIACDENGHLLPWFQGRWEF